MYTIYLLKKNNLIGKQLIYHPLYKNMEILSGSADLELNCAGECEFTIPHSHKYYDEFEPFIDGIQILDDGEEIFLGQITNIDVAFNKSKTIKCEGRLAWLADALWNGAREGFSEACSDALRLAIDTDLNAQSDFHCVFNGVNAPSIATTVIEAPGWGTSLRDIADTVLETAGGYISCKKVLVGQVYYYYFYYSAYPNGSSSPEYNDQVIKLGKNLLSYAQTNDYSELYTCVVPIGKDGIVLGASIQSAMIINEDLVDKYGYKVCTKEFGTVPNSTTLGIVADSWLKRQQGIQSIELSAIDLSYLNLEYRRFKLGQYAKLDAKPFGFDGTEATAMLISKMHIDLMSVANSTLTLGMTRNELTKRVLSRSI